MKANAKMKIITAALCTAGLVSAPYAVADNINGTLVPPLAQSVVPTDYTVSYPVTIAIVGQGVQNLNFVYNGATGVWTAPEGYTYDAALNPNDNTAVFTTTLTPKGGEQRYDVRVLSFRYQVGMDTSR